MKLITLPQLALMFSLGLSLTVYAETNPHAHHNIVAPAKSSISRVVTIEMGKGQEFRFSPEKIDIKQGETIKFRFNNVGKMAHEFVVGTEAELKKHQQDMVENPTSAHHEMNTIAPNSKSEITMTFDKKGTFLFACLIAGHFESGMKGFITVSPKK
ncbi:MAG: cupredoxin domain-containing protein [Neisseriaceae bacterium]|nr:cupredoxin domain-containing protein [Neisseriaceae bacterium]